MNHAQSSAATSKTGRILGALGLVCAMALSTVTVGCATVGAKTAHVDHKKKRGHQRLAGNEKVKNYSLDNGRANPDWLRRGRAALPTAFD
jgi:hypothetical protein